MCNQQILPSFKDSLFSDSTKSILKDFVEIGIDSIMHDGLLKNIPIVNTLISIGKFGANIHDRNMLKQTLVFIESFNNQTIYEEKLSAYKDKINGNPKKAEEELGRVIILLSSNIDDIKSKVLAAFFASYINKIISWNKFCELSDVTSRIFLSDLPLLDDIYKKTIINSEQNDSYHVQRLNSIGLIYIEIGDIIINGGDAFGDTSEPTERGITRDYKITELGEIFCRIGINK